MTAKHNARREHPSAQPASVRPDPTPPAFPVFASRPLYEHPGDTPHQGFADDAGATVEVFDGFADGLAGIDDVVRLTVVYWADRESLHGDDGVGAFARRTPNRPNSLNVCTCTLLERDGRRLRVRGLDTVDGSPVVDLEPALQSER